MKAITLTQPWASLVAFGEKRFETRGWGTNHTGQVAIHAAKGYPAWAREVAGEPLFRRVLARHGLTAETLPTGAIVGLVEIAGCGPASVVRPLLSLQDEAFGDFSGGRWAWDLRSPVALAVPVPCKGALSLWDVPADVLAAVQAQIAPARVEA